VSPRGVETATAEGTVIHERRAVRRIVPKQALEANVMMVQPVRVLNISSRGAQIEVACALPPSGPCDLRIQFDEGEFAVHATIRRCSAVDLGADENDEPVMLYRAGLEFGELDPESLAWLSSHVLFQAQA
jgi:PilZ domain